MVERLGAGMNLDGISSSKYGNMMEGTHGKTMGLCVADMRIYGTLWEVMGRYGDLWGL